MAISQVIAIQWGSPVEINCIQCFLSRVITDDQVTRNRYMLHLPQTNPNNNNLYINCGCQTNDRVAAPFEAPWYPVGKLCSTNKRLVKTLHVIPFVYRLDCFEHWLIRTRKSVLATRNPSPTGYVAIIVSKLQGGCLCRTRQACFLA